MVKEGRRYRNRGRKRGEEMEEVQQSETERKERSRAKACHSVMLLVKCRAFRPLVEAIKRKKRLW